MATIQQDCDRILQQSLNAVKPDSAVRRALQGKDFGGGRLILVAVGKAAWQMAHTASQALQGKLTGGIVITKYGHSGGAIPGVSVYEAGHPVPDENSYLATKAALALTKDLSRDDHVLFLLSGGGSAL
ncbi:MAG: DUF4147 domain-containing protein, partial [Firmicutes bacterium]|nr:DUF4147 domain-containing protein [Bacillota bacterium]